MKNLIVIVCLLGIALSTKVILDSIETMERLGPTFSAEDIERIRNGTPKPYEITTVDLFSTVISQKMQSQEVYCMRKNIFFEARNQSHKARLAVAWVTINRAKVRSQTICEVVYDARLDSRGNPLRHQCQFSWFCDGKSDRPNLNNKIEKQAWEEIGKLSRLMIENCYMGINLTKCPSDPTRGATYYHTKKVKPSWSQQFTRSGDIEDHIFYVSD